MCSMLIQTEQLIKSPTLALITILAMIPTQLGLQAHSNVHLTKPVAH